MEHSKPLMVTSMDLLLCHLMDWSLKINYQPISEFVGRAKTTYVVFQLELVYHYSWLLDNNNVYLIKRPY